MNFKIDTKEKFTVITPLSEDLSDKLTEELVNCNRAVKERLKKYGSKSEECFFN